MASRRAAISLRWRETPITAGSRYRRSPSAPAPMWRGCATWRATAARRLPRHPGFPGAPQHPVAGSHDALRRRDGSRGPAASPGSIAMYRSSAACPSACPRSESYVPTTAKPEARLHLATTDDKGETVPILALLAIWQRRRAGAGDTRRRDRAACAGWRCRNIRCCGSQIVRNMLPTTSGPGMTVALELERRAGAGGRRCAQRRWRAGRHAGARGHDLAGRPAGRRSAPPADGRAGPLHRALRRGCARHLHGGRHRETAMRRHRR